ncbi:MAG TPA: hypothetical protein VK524_12815 [Polyangiaceae bacterium]|nr:hypothetical protein [Polyangiaceae bacterium]
MIRLRVIYAARVLGFLFTTGPCFADSEPSETKSNSAPIAPASQEPDPDSQREERAQALFRRGIALAAEERWHEAERIFAESFDTVPRPSAAFNRALALYRLGRMLEVVETIGRFLALTDARHDAAQRLRATELQARARAALATLLVRVEPLETRLEMDGVVRTETGTTRSFSVDPGEHLLILSRSGYRSERRRVVLGAAERGSLAVTLRSAPAESARAEAPPRSAPSRVPVESESRGPGALPWVVVGAGAVTLAAGATTGILALKKESDLDRRCNLVDETCPPEARDEQRDLKTLVTATDVLLVTGSVLCVAGVGWYWFSRKAPVDVTAAALPKGAYLSVGGNL